MEGLLVLIFAWFTWIFPNDLWFYCLCGLSYTHFANLFGLVTNSVVVRQSLYQLIFSFLNIELLVYLSDCYFARAVICKFSFTLYWFEFNLNVIEKFCNRDNYHLWILLCRSHCRKILSVACELSGSPFKLVIWPISYKINLPILFDLSFFVQKE